MKPSEKIHLIINQLNIMSIQNAVLTKLASLLEEANQKNMASDKSDTFGKCEWVDIDGNQRCNSPWSEFQCQQVGGTFYEGERC